MAEFLRLSYGDIVRQTSVLVNIMFSMTFDRDGAGGRIR